MPSLHDRVIATLDRQPPERGVIVYGAGRVLAVRDPDMTIAWPSAVLIVLDVEALSAREGRG